MAPQRRRPGLPATDPDVKVARRLFFVGFLALPWLWGVSAAYYWPKARQRGSNSELWKYVRNSLIGFVVSFAIFATWASVLKCGHSVIAVQPATVSAYVTASVAIVATAAAG